MAAGAAAQDCLFLMDVPKMNRKSEGNAGLSMCTTHRRHAKTQRGLPKKLRKKGIGVVAVAFC